MASHDFCQNPNCVRCNAEDQWYQKERRMDPYKVSIRKLKEIMPTLSLADQINVQVTLDILEQELKKIK